VFLGWKVDERVVEERGEDFLRMRRNLRIWVSMLV